MRDNKVTKRPSGLTLTWVPVQDARGRTHMEARWSVPVVAAAQPHIPHHAA
jgi:hypothetical protein